MDGVWASKISHSEPHNDAQSMQTVPYLSSFKQVHFLCPFWNLNGTCGLSRWNIDGPYQDCDYCRPTTTIDIQIIENSFGTYGVL